MWGICTVTSDAVEGKGKPEIVYRDLTVPRKNLSGRSKKDSKGEIACIETGLLQS